MARAKKTTTKTSSKAAAKPAPKAAGAKTRGQKIAEAQKKNAEFRSYLSEMTSVQLTNFVKKLDNKTLTRLQRALNNAEEKAKEAEKQRLQKKIERLQKQMKDL